MNNINNLNPGRRIITQGYQGYNIKFSSLHNLVAVAGAENFGIKGGGSVLIYDLFKPNPLIQRYVYSDAVFDVAWSKVDPCLMLTGTGDGFIQLWATNKPNQDPVACIRVHEKEVSSVEFVTFDHDYLTSSSWDSKIALSDMMSLGSPVCLLESGTLSMVYEAKWSTVRERCLASVESSGNTFIWSPFNSNKPIVVLPNVGSEILSCDWSYSDPNYLVTACTGATVHLWDLRSPHRPLLELRGHENAIRKVRYNPFLTDEIATVSYDFTTRLWDTARGFEISAVRNHTEFVYGVDFSLCNIGLMADCSWDQTIIFYEIGPPKPFPQQQAHFTVASEPPQFPSQTNPVPKPLPPLPPN